MFLDDPIIATLVVCAFWVVAVVAWLWLLDLIESISARRRWRRAFHQPVIRDNGIHTHNTTEEY
jgi:hypothetical protein